MQGLRLLDAGTVDARPSSAVCGCPVERPSTNSRYQSRSENKGLPTTKAIFFFFYPQEHTTGYCLHTDNSFFS